MNSKLGYYWQQLRASLWFVPGVLVLFSFGLAYGLVEFDTNTAWKGKKQLRLIVAARSFDRFMQLAFDLPRINAKGNHAVLLRLLQALALTASGAGSLPDRKQTMQQQAILLLAWANQTLESEYEKQAVQASFVAHRDAWE
ncbi:hypothetical protein [Fibrella aquatica]|uniref:hypothetical protein n=1 Tax=Fibrella aquatica TaxID=3242487 RepID=UPI003520DCF5